MKWAKEGRGRGDIEEEESQIYSGVDYELPQPMGGVGGPPLGCMAKLHYFSVGGDVRHFGHFATL